MDEHRCLIDYSPDGVLCLRCRCGWLSNPIRGTSPDDLLLAQRNHVFEQRNAAAWNQPSFDDLEGA
jgi:hypothetical protein